MPKEPWKHDKTFAGSVLCLIYTRVSTVRQSKEGEGLASQEAICREFAIKEGMKVVMVFSDEMTGSDYNRPGLTSMLEYIRQAKTEVVVIVDHQDRIARENMHYWIIMEQIEKAGGRFISPINRFSKDPSGIMVQNMVATFSQYKRQENTAQVNRRMRGRLLDGHWPFPLPVGYKHQQLNDRGGKSVVRVEPVASIVAEGLNGYATGVFKNLTEIAEFLTSHLEFPFASKVYVTRVGKMLRTKLYAGYYEYPKWDIPLTLAQHEPLIDLETFDRIQDRLSGMDRKPPRSGIAEDFPLRGFAVCDECDGRMTACWSKSRNGNRFPYYMCKTKACAVYGKSIRRAALEGEMEGILKSLEVSDEAFKVIDVMLRDACRLQNRHHVERNEKLKQKLGSLEGELSKLLARVVRTESAIVQKALEKEIERIEEKRLHAEALYEQSPQTEVSYVKNLELTRKFLSSPWNIWENGGYDAKKAVLDLAFAEPVRVTKEKQVRTPIFSFPFRELHKGFKGDVGMVEHSGIEPLTSCMPCRRSPS